MKLNEIFDKKEQIFLQKELPNYDFDVIYNDDTLVKFEDELQDLITMKGFDEYYDINDLGIELERLLDKYVDYIDENEIS